MYIEADCSTHVLLYFAVIYSYVLYFVDTHIVRYGCGWLVMVERLS